MGPLWDLAQPLVVDLLQLAYPSRDSRRGCVSLCAGSATLRMSVVPAAAQLTSADVVERMKAQIPNLFQTGLIHFQ